MKLPFRTDCILYFMTRMVAMLFIMGKPVTVPIIILNLELKVSVGYKDDAVCHLQEQ